MVAVVSLRTAVQRVRSAAWPVLQTSLAAGIAWLIAHDWLGHAQPFFAPIAAAVSLSTSHVQRARRSAQMIVGVLLGIGVSEVVHPLLGTGWVSIAVVVAVTLVLALALGVGFFGEGMMFVNQAAASAILVVALHRAGTGSERAIDALVGGGVALVIGVGLFPVEPVKLLWRAEDRVLGAVLAVLGREPLAGARAGAGDPQWPLAASFEIHRRLSALTAARNTARASVRVAPRRVRLRGLIDAEERRVSRIYLLAGGSLSLARAALDAEHAGERDAVQREMLMLAGAVRTLLAAERPWRAPALLGAHRDLSALADAPPPPGGPERVAVWNAAQRVASDLLAVTSSLAPGPGA
jgi:uncharacterized membrane protein YgaE (UPF0421/DUF939 family)